MTSKLYLQEQVKCSTVSQESSCQVKSQTHLELGGWRFKVRIQYSLLKET